MLWHPHPSVWGEGAAPSSVQSTANKYSLSCGSPYWGARWGLLTHRPAGAAQGSASASGGRVLLFQETGEVAEGTGTDQGLAALFLSGM